MILWQTFISLTVFKMRGPMLRNYVLNFLYFCILKVDNTCDAVIYTYEDVELRRIFPNEFPLDTIRRSGSPYAEHLGRYNELKRYFRHPKDKLNSHFEEMICYDNGENKVCKVDVDRYLPEENSYYSSPTVESHVDRRRVYCFMLLCFTEDELDRVVASF